MGLGPGGSGPLEREHRAQRAWRRAAGAKNFEFKSAFIAILLCFAYARLNGL